MNFLDYIKGNRKGKDAQRIEKDSMADPFLYEAIEGFDSIEDDHIRRIGNIQSRLKARSKVRNRQQSTFWQVAATVAILIFGLAGYLFIDYYHKPSLHAHGGEQRIIDIYVPQTYYVENITTIAQKNVEVAKAYKPAGTHSKIRLSTDDIISEEELDELIGNEDLPIEIYLPENFDEHTAVTRSADGKPEPVIGFDKFQQYLKQSMRRPTDDACKDRKGKVVVDFFVNDQGQPCLFEVVQSLCGTSDNEAIRLIQSGPKWTLGKERVRVRVEF
ncbi:hypothetical protein M2451_001013 [Dysgonomonas sp. PFB1-18]|uniref:hypothetical protein n=1 Tax=unclassified Dysgonomonas TaxID=2630389 RepID=UPI0024760809|nr:MULTISPECIES: hypothetical protein [unclassified Dysgonomonas]MDH6308364.1 hypothetical protein [Dysgonomonas sp. PF1-14]MDH6338199.1 hypothetical protein [Dysgonomonas sp. PF1-16]MDH6379696.1 hypothetical protein [Dysgonomonas sp. PFB1-18]MDH6397215.1 hypothetical protein [Dysgonomonas sp. PF1-23]